jgi:hypothetical protein
MVGASTVLVLLYARVAGTLAQELAPRIARARLWLVIANTILVCAILLFAFVERANDAADVAKAGAPVEPVRIFGVELLGFRADLAMIALADPKAATTDAYKELKDADTLLYLGRSSSSLVVYEKDRQSAWHLPASIFAVRAMNCETNVRDRNPACPD